jgi:hypothetical protein
VKVSNGEGTMQCLCLGGRLIRRRMHDAIELTLDDAGQKEPRDDKNSDYQNEPDHALEAYHFD